MAIRYWLWILVLGLLTGCDDDSKRPVAKAPAAAQAKFRPNPPATGRTLQVLVKDKETGLALGNERITVYVNDQKTNDFTAVDGIYFVRLPENGLTHLSVHARAIGHVPMMMRWSANGAELTDIPAEYAMAVEKGTTLSGVLRDDAGNPIVGVGVMLWPESYWGKTGEHANYVHHSFKTDATGRWTCDIAPSDPPLPITFMFYPAPQGYEIRGRQFYKGVPLEEFRDGTAEELLKRAVPTK